MSNPEPAWVEITDPDENLWRQVHPNWLSSGRLSSQAFRATTKDQGLLSVARGAKVSAHEAFDRHVGRGNTSVGVAAATVADVHEVASGMKLSITVWDDSADQRLPDEHASIDCRELAGSKIKTFGDLMARRARDRGWAYTPPPGPPPPIAQASAASTP